MRKIVAGKRRDIRVTDADLEYHGSITLNPDHCEAVRERKSFGLQWPT